MTEIVKKTRIPKAVRRAVWLKYIGKKWESNCYISWCPNKLDVLGPWHCGHNIPDSKGGTLSISNLRPICSTCNLGMGNEYTIDEWNKTYKYIDKQEFNIAQILLKLCCPMNKTVREQP